MRVLVVGVEGSVVGTLRSVLEPHGWELREVGTLPAALGAAAEQDLLLVGRRGLAQAAPAPPTLNLEERERHAIVQALEATGWNKQAAARLLGLHRPTLYSKMRKHGIPQRPPQAPSTQAPPTRDRAS